MQVSGAAAMSMIALDPASTELILLGNKRIKGGGQTNSNIISYNKYYAKKVNLKKKKKKESKSQGQRYQLDEKPSLRRWHLSRDLKDKKKSSHSLSAYGGCSLS